MKKYIFSRKNKTLEKIFWFCTRSKVPYKRPKNFLNKRKEKWLPRERRSDGRAKTHSERSLPDGYKFSPPETSLPVTEDTRLGKEQPRKTGITTPNQEGPITVFWEGPGTSFPSEPTDVGPRVTRSRHRISHWTNRVPLDPRRQSLGLRWERSLPRWTEDGPTLSSTLNRTKNLQKLLVWRTETTEVWVTSTRSGPGQELGFIFTR